MCKWTIFGTMNAIFGVINIALFALWWSVIEDSRNITTYDLDVITTQINILTVVITVVTLLLALAAILGYNAIKDAAIVKATEKAVDVANVKVAEFLAEHKQNKSARDVEPSIRLQKQMTISKEKLENDE